MCPFCVELYVFKLLVSVDSVYKFIKSDSTPSINEIELKQQTQRGEQPV